MKPHIRIYLDFFEYTGYEYMPCEVCMMRRAVDVNHLSARGMGGDPTGKKDHILNLMGTCRECHIEYADKKQHKDYLKNTHLKFMQSRQPEKTKKILLEIQNN